MPTNTEHPTKNIYVLREDNQAVKFDLGKPQYDLVPWDALEEVVKVLNYGAQKYDPRNWEKGMDWSRMFAAGIRHDVEFWQKLHDIDQESGLPHLAHGICCRLFLLSYWLRKVGKDDRPRSDQ
jgi:hypothetical protein